MPKKTLNEATIRQFMKLVNHKPTTISNFISENFNEEALEERYAGNEAGVDLRKGSRGGQGAGEIKAGSQQKTPGKKLDLRKDKGSVDVQDAEMEESVQAEGMYEEEGEELDAEMPPAPEPDAEMDAVADVAGGGELDIPPEMAQALIEFGEMLAGAMGAEAGAEEPPMDDEMGDPVGDEPAPDLDAAPEEEVMEGEENIAEAEEGTVSEEQIVQDVARRVAKRILKARQAQKNLNDALGNK